METITPLPAPPLSLPPSTSLVTLQAVDTTLCLYVKSTNFLDPVLPGHEIYNCPTMAFFLTHQKTGRKILFDAGGRKDYWNSSPFIVGRFAKGVNVKGMRCEKGVDEVLMDAGQRLEDVEAVVWSHWHFDHVGDMSKFPPSVNLVVGEGFKENLLPGYPANPESALLESDYENPTEVVTSKRSNSKTTSRSANSFYLLDVPGHAIGHICGLARTTPTTFALLGADTCHFMGALRPTPFIPLPSTLSDCNLDPYFPNPCPCSMFTSMHPSTSASTESEIESKSARTTPYYKASKAPGSAYSFPELANKSINGLKEFDASDDVFVCLAHDPALFEVLPLMNAGKEESINAWREQGWKEKTRWMFLNELPRGGKPGREPLVFGFWRGEECVSSEVALRRD